MRLLAIIGRDLLQRPPGRSFLPDLLKAVGCVLIVLHHLAFYGPMSDVLAQRWPALIEGLADHGRLAVQIFLVCSGYLTAESLQARSEMNRRRLLSLSARRYLRLAIPLMVALAVTVLVSEWIRPHFEWPSLSATPEWPQMLAHVLLLQHLLDMEALSAGVWYVAIDFQLYVLTLLAMWGVSLWQGWRPYWRGDALLLQVMLALTVVSLLRWNLNPDMDDYGLYFFGAYGMGWLAHRSRRSRIPPKGWGVLLALGTLALWVDPRWRIATAWGTALLLAAAPRRWMTPAEQAGALRGAATAVHGLAQVSYSVFLIHYAVGLVLSAVVTAAWPESLLANALGLLLAVCFSVLAGAGLHRLTEQGAPSLRRWLWAVGGFALACALVRWWGSAA